MSFDRHREEKEAAALRMKVRGVARLLGARFVEPAERQHWHAIELAPTVHLHASRAWPKKGMITWRASCPAAPRAYSAPSIGTSLSRPAAAIVADLRARLIPEAREWCRKSITQHAAHRDIENARRAHLAELEQILGPMRQVDRHHYGEGFSIEHDSLTGGYRGQFNAKIEVRSWHCLLMIAKLVAEDTRIARAAAPAENDEHAA